MRAPAPALSQSFRSCNLPRICHNFTSFEFSTPLSNDYFPSWPPKRALISCSFVPNSKCLSQSPLLPSFDTRFFYDVARSYLGEGRRKRRRESHDDGLGFLVRFLQREALWWRSLGASPKEPLLRSRLQSGSDGAAHTNVYLMSLLGLTL